MRPHIASRDTRPRRAHLCDPPQVQPRAQEEVDAIEAELDPETLVTTEAREKREPPPQVVLPLLPYQKEWLAWGLKQELGPLRGGILADEMGAPRCVRCAHAARAGCIFKRRLNRHRVEPSCWMMHGAALTAI